MSSGISIFPVAAVVGLIVLFGIVALIAVLINNKK